MDPARIRREPDVENLRTDFIGCPSLLTRHAKKKNALWIDEIGGIPKIYSYTVHHSTPKSLCKGLL